MLNWRTSECLAAATDDLLSSEKRGRKECRSWEKFGLVRRELNPMSHELKIVHGQILRVEI